MQRKSILCLSVIFCMILAFSVGAEELGEPFGTHHDLGGETVTMVSWVEGVPDRYQEGGDAAGRLEKAEELFNCEIEFIAPANWSDINEAYMSRLLAGESDYDFWRIIDRHFYDLAAEEAVYPLNNIYEKYEDFEYTIQTRLLTLHENVYRLQSMSAEKDLGLAANMTVVGFNKRIFENEGLPNPYKLYREGEWDYDNFTEIARKATRDTTGDGEIDQWGMTNIPATAWLFTNIGEVFASVDGQYEVVMGDKVRKAVEQYRQWNIEDEVMDGWIQEFVEGTHAMSSTQLWQFNKNLRLEDLEDEWGIVPLPKGPDADENPIVLQDIGGWVLPLNVEQPEAMLALFSYLHYDSPDTIAEQKKEQINNYIWDQEAYEIILNMNDEIHERGKCLVPRGDAFFEYLSPAMWDVFDGEQTYEEAINEVKPQAQQVLDDLYN